MAPKKKKITFEDAAIWKHLIKSVTPLSSKKIEINFFAKEIKKPLPSFSLLKSNQPRQILEPNINLLPLMAVNGSSSNMDKRSFQRMLKGKMNIDGRLDLHGLTASQAKIRLISYLKQSHISGLRMILVITGKGKIYGVDEFNRPKGGVLRKSLADWLSDPALNHIVLQVTPAQRRHGGSGAWYVYLRRQR